MKLDIRTTAEITAQTITNNSKEWANVKWVRLTEEIKSKLVYKGLKEK